MQERKGCTKLKVGRNLQVCRRRRIAIHDHWFLAIIHHNARHVVLHAHAEYRTGPSTERHSDQGARMAGARGDIVHGDGATRLSNTGGSVTRLANTGGAGTGKNTLGGGSVAGFSSPLQEVCRSRIA